MNQSWYMNPAPSVDWTPEQGSPLCIYQLLYGDRCCKHTIYMSLCKEHYFEKQELFWYYKHTIYLNEFNEDNLIEEFKVTYDLAKKNRYINHFVVFINLIHIK